MKILGSAEAFEGDFFTWMPIWLDGGFGCDIFLWW